MEALLHDRQLLHLALDIAGRMGVPPPRKKTRRVATWVDALTSEFALIKALLLNLQLRGNSPAEPPPHNPRVEVVRSVRQSLLQSF